MKQIRESFARFVPFLGELNDKYKGRIEYVLVIIGGIASGFAISEYFNNLQDEKQKKLYTAPELRRSLYCAGTGITYKNKIPLSCYFNSVQVKRI